MLAILGTVLLTGAFYYAGERLLYYGLEHFLANTGFLEESTKRSVEQFQEYVTENGLASVDNDRIYQWTKGREPISLGVMDDSVNVDTFYDDKVVAEDIYSEETEDPLAMGFFFDIEFSDKTARIYYDGFYDYKASMAVIGIMIILSLVFFIFVFTLLIKRKIRYVNRLEEGIHIFESGDLHYEIEVKGCDELAGLAGSLNDMRLSLDRQIAAKEEAFQANRSLITALSHDLRTPLTTQTGYLEILREGHYETKEEHDRYVDKCLDNCRQLKQMSDRLFDYFMAFRREEDETCETELFDAGELFLQFISENIFLLEEDGYTFHLEMMQEKAAVKANVEYLCRIFDNIVSNLKKYAEKSRPIRIFVGKKQDYVEVSVSNSCRMDSASVESSKIGLENVKSLMRYQSGYADIQRDEESFCVTLHFPAV